MYSWSMEWYERCFVQSCKNAPPSEEASASRAFEARLIALRETFTLGLYRSVCRALFGKHKVCSSRPPYLPWYHAPCPNSPDLPW